VRAVANVQADDLRHVAALQRGEGVSQAIEQASGKLQAVVNRGKLAGQIEGVPGDIQAGLLSGIQEALAETQAKPKAGEDKAKPKGKKDTDEEPNPLVEAGALIGKAVAVYKQMGGRPDLMPKARVQAAALQRAKDQARRQPKAKKPGGTGGDYGGDKNQ
jgi:hypothetical protein